MKKILTVFGTRPEAIKMAPLIKELETHGDFNCKVCVTGQHREMLDQVLELFSITPDFDLKVMKPKQTLASLTASILQSITKVIKSFEPDLIIVHGDTTTTLATSLAAYYEKTTICHIEAGLRTNDIYAPWPEEINRRITSVITNLHFAPTPQAKKNLLQEGVNKNKIFVTGNTVIDALHYVQNIVKHSDSIQKNLLKEFSFIDPDLKLILVTGHRRENFGKGFMNICNALKELVQLRDDIQVIYPVHLNPNVLNTVKEILDSQERIYLLKPLNYLSFSYLMDQAYIILTDSGGIQEEAPSLGKPVLVLREKTERPEAIAAGTIQLVGTSKAKILKSTINLLDNKEDYRLMSSAKNPYGDGKAAKRIVKELLKFREENDQY